MGRPERPPSPTSIPEKEQASSQTSSAGEDAADDESFSATFLAASNDMLDCMEKQGEVEHQTQLFSS